jgi:hypothetical protein
MGQMQTSRKVHLRFCSRCYTDKSLPALWVEWAKLYARSRRWNEEVQTLKEEFRRLPVSLEFEAEVWDQRLKDVPVGQIDGAGNGGIRVQAGSAFPRSRGSCEE